MNKNACAPANVKVSHPFFANSPFAALFNDEFFGGSDAAGFMPAVNVTEDEKKFELEVAAPGFTKEQFKVKLQNNLLTIAAETKSETVNEGEGEKKNYTRREFRYGSFKRSFRVNEDKVNSQEITARYENGILHIALPKKVAEKKENGFDISIL